jgi:hypothetical protein
LVSSLEKKPVSVIFDLQNAEVAFEPELERSDNHPAFRDEPSSGVAFAGEQWLSDIG